MYSYFINGIWGYTKQIDLTLFMLAFTELELCHVSKRLLRIAVKWWQQVISESYLFTIFTNCHFHNYLYTIRSFHFTSFPLLILKETLS